MEANQGQKEYFQSTLTLRNQMGLALDIAKILTVNQRKLFERTCFGPWLKVHQGSGDPLLTHIFLQHETDELPVGIQRGDEEMWFHFPPAYTRFGHEEFCLVTGLCFGRHDSFGPYTDHIPTPAWVFRVFPDYNKHDGVRVEYLQMVFNKDRLKQFNDIDVVRVCLMLLVEVGFWGKQKTAIVPKDLLKLADDLEAWNMFPWGSYLWHGVWDQLSTSKLKSRTRYTLTEFIWAFKIWIFEAFLHMRVYATRTKNFIPRALNWHRKVLLKWPQLKSYMPINDEADLPLQTLTPMEEESATDWWQASRRFFDGVDDVDPPVFQVRDGDLSEHQNPPPSSRFTHRSDSPPPLSPRFTHRADSPPPLSARFTQRADSPPPLSPRFTQRADSSPPKKVPRIHSPTLSLQGDRVKYIDLEIHALRDEERALREIVSPLQDEVRALRKEVRVLRAMMPPFQEEVHELHDEIMDDMCYSEPDPPPSDLVFSVPRRGLRLRRLGPTITTPYTPLPLRRRNKDRQAATTEGHVSEAGAQPVPEAPPIQEAQPVQDAGSVVKRLPIEVRKHYISGLSNIDWSTYHLPPSRIHMEDRFKLEETIEDNSLWAKNAVEFYLCEEGQECYVDISKFRQRHVHLDRKWWGILIGVEEMGYFESSHIDVWSTRLLVMRAKEVLPTNSKQIKKQDLVFTNSQWTIMLASFMNCELYVGTEESYSIANGKCRLHPTWSTVDKVFIPISARAYWFLVELQLPSFNTVVYDSLFTHINISEMEEIFVSKLRNHLPKYLDMIRYWEKSRIKKPKKIKVKMTRDESVPQQAMNGLEALFMLNKRLLERYSILPLLLLRPLISEWNALQHPVASAFLAVIYSDYMRTSQTKKIQCDADAFSSSDLRKFAASQANYVLGDNPMKMSYLVGYGDNEEPRYLLMQPLAALMVGNGSNQMDLTQMYLVGKAPERAELRALVVESILEIVRALKYDDQVDGTIIAPSSFKPYGSGLFQWILFTKLVGLTIQGQGTIDGSGSIWWKETPVNDPFDNELKLIVPINDTAEQPANSSISSSLGGNF